MLNKYLDHAVLLPQMTRQEATDWIQSGIKYKVKTVCVRPCDIDLAVKLCKGTETEVSCVLGFPHGSICTESKAAEAMLYCKKGIAEIDMVANYGWIRSEMWDEVRNDIKAVVDVAHANSPKVLVKVIFETSQLTKEQIIKTTEICIEVGADFVKTSTGFNGEGAKEEDVDCMLNTAAGRIKVKPSGGIRDAVRARMFIDKGVHRLGVNGSSSPAICDGDSEACKSSNSACNSESCNKNKGGY
ncbi:MAG: deoxyribose-phosphate aldolase [Thermoguttaceae bacterium]